MNWLIQTSQRFYDWLESQSHNTRIGVIAGLVLFVAVIDFLAGETLSFYVLYFPIVWLAVWLLSLPAALVTALVCSVLWVLDDYIAPDVVPSDWAKYFNTTTRFVVFGGFALLLSRLRTSLEHEKQLSRSDALTGLANRAALFEVAERDVAICHRRDLPLSVAFIDCDNFKAINERFGHAAGDRVLCEIANVFRMFSRKNDYVARLGGDEFVLWAPDADADSAQAMIVRLREALLKCMHDRGWPITFSIGMVTYEHPPELVDTIINQADDLMFQVKHRSKDGILHRSFRKKGAPVLDVSSWDELSTSGVCGTA